MEGDDGKKSASKSGGLELGEKEPKEKAKLSRSMVDEKKNSKGPATGTLKDDEDEEFKQRMMDEEEMLDIAEHCFIRIAELLLESNRNVRSIFSKYAIPEQFPDGTILELISPIAFLEGVKESGLEGLREVEAACLLRVLAKPELENAVILNEFAMIMENFGVADGPGAGDEEDEDDLDDYPRSTSSEEEAEAPKE
jgi:hypothetical protein